MPTINSLQQMGMVQRKLGRSITTLSISYSDKIVRSNILGVQGLYSIYLKNNNKKKVKHQWLFTSNFRPWLLPGMR